MTKKLIYSSSLFLICAAMAFSSIAQEGTVKGKVLGREGPLQSATVTIGNKTVLTDKNGEFSFALVQGNYDIAITHTSYKGITQSIKIDPGNPLAIEVTMTLNEELGEVVVLGSRSSVQRSNLISAVPVDVFTSRLLSQTGRVSFTQMLNYVAPSINASREVANEAITLRGLNPDQVLILLNGTRYHSLAFLSDGSLRGLLSRGSVSNDINSIPFAAIEKVEVLRDGASAQYGSDAIAGVINFQLKEFTGKTSLTLHTGQCYKGDGENFAFAVHKSIALSTKGYLNFNWDMRYRNSTFRRGRYTGTVYKPLLANTNFEDSVRIRNQDDSIIKARNFNRDKVSHAGTARLNNYGILINGAYHIHNKIELFWTGAINNRANEFRGLYRYPKNPSVVNTALYPDGFNGIIRPVLWNISGIVGAKGELKQKSQWEYSSAYGKSSASYHSRSTNNASQFALGKDAPTSFYTGKLIYQQLTNNLNFTKKFAKTPGKAEYLNLNLGAELRIENYQLKAGEEAAWKNYDPSGRIQGGSQNSLVISPDNVVNENRVIGGAYVDLESEFKEKFLVNLAGRYEYFSDFGGNLAGKIALRYKISNMFLWRASIGNGYRAPSLQQRYFSFINSSVPINNGGLLTPGRTGIFNNKSEVAAAFGIEPLQAEKSTNINTGLTAKLPFNIQTTIDAYWIEVRDRIVLSGRLEKINFPDLSVIFVQNQIDLVQFFTNAVKTRTRGIDIVINGKWYPGKSTIGLTLAANFNQTDVVGDVKTSNIFSSNPNSAILLFPLEERTRIEKGQPRDKIILSMEYKIGKFGMRINNTRFGSTSVVFENNNRLRDEYFSPRILTDIYINYFPTPRLTLTAGINNIFDVYPDPIKNPMNTAEGIFIYSQEASPFGYNGGYYFLSLAFSW